MTAFRTPKGFGLSGDHHDKLGAAIGIGVTSYNRRPLLERFIASVRDTTRLPYDLVVADDGSCDGSLEWCREQGVTVVGGTNRGIAWNKNRALYTLTRYSMAAVIVLFDDDCFPDAPDWSQIWFDAAERWGHIMGVHPEVAAALDRGEYPDTVVSGAGTPADPYRCLRISGCAIASTRSALSRVGYFDSRFKGYGHEHSEWTLRFHRFGYGFDRDAVSGRKCNLMLRYGLGYANVPTTSDKSNVAQNRKIMDELKKESSYRLPWNNEAEKSLLLSEVSAALDPLFANRK